MNSKRARATVEAEVKVVQMFTVEVNCGKKENVEGGDGARCWWLGDVRGG